MANFDMGQAHDAVHSDTANDNFNWIAVGTGGTVTILLEGGNTFELTAPGVNFWIPVGVAVAVMSTGTTATDIMVV